jgi:hypothetical protein
MNTLLITGTWFGNFQKACSSIWTDLDLQSYNESKRDTLDPLEPV